MREFEYKGEILTLRQTEYFDGRKALVIEDAEGSPYSTLTVNIPGVKLAEGEYLIKTWSENEQISKAVKGLFTDTGRRILPKRRRK